MAWINGTPEACEAFISSLEQEADSLLTSSWDTALSVLSKLTPTVSESSCNGKPIDSCPGSPSGTTLAPLTDIPGVTEWMWSARAFLANLGARLVSEKGKQTTATCGLTPSASFATYDPATHSLRTSQGSLLSPICDEYSATLPKHGMTCGGVCSALTMWGPITAGNVSGYWLPTATAHQGGWNQGGGNGREGQPMRPSLQHMARHNLWPTPQSFDATGIQRSKEALMRAKQKGGCANLREAVQMFPTPRAIYGEHPGMKDEKHLTGAVQMWATPLAASTGVTRRKWREGSDNLQTQVGGQLSPRWTAWLMGWPIGWESCEPLAMDRCLCVPLQPGQS